MMSFKHGAAFAFGLAVAFGMPAEATAVTYGFTATANGGPLNGNVFNGVFTVDPSVVAAGSGTIAIASFTFLGSTYTGSDAAFSSVPMGFFDGSGNATGIGSFSVLSTARANAIGDSVDGRAMTAPASSFSFGFSFGYGADPAGGETFTGGQISGAQVNTAAVPEPASLALFSVGMLGLAAARKRLRS